MRLGLRVEVTTSRGARIGVPRLLELFCRRDARATFFFALGPDRLLGRSWLPGAELGRRCIAVLREVRDAGFEPAIQAFDPLRWTGRVCDADEAWTRRQMEKACAAFLQVFDAPARAHSASGWRMNRHAWRLTQRLGFEYSSDTRGSCPFVPVRNAEIIACPQLPTTLPTLNEVIARDGVPAEEAVGRVLRASTDPPATGHIYTLHAEDEGIRHASLLEGLLDGWRAQGYALAALEDFMKDVNPARLPRHAVIEGTVAGRKQPVALQGDAFLA